MAVPNGGYVRTRCGPRPIQSVTWPGPGAALCRLVAVVAFAAAAGTTIWVQFRSRVRAFRADADGLRLGFGPAGTTSKRDLSCGDVQQLRISGLKRGVMLEVLVNASAAPVYRSQLRQFADLAFMLAVLSQTRLRLRTRKSTAPEYEAAPKPRSPTAVLASEFYLAWPARLSWHY